MRKFRSILLMGVIAVLMTAGVASAGNGLVAIQKIDGYVGGDTVNAGENLRFTIKMDNTGTNGVGEKCDVANGFKISSNDGALWDSVVLDSTLGVTIDGENAWLLLFSITGTIGNFNVGTHGGVSGSADTVGTLQAGKGTKPLEQLPITWNDSTFIVTVYFHDKASAGKHICIDSAFFGTGGTWSWVGKSLTVYTPEFGGFGTATHQDGLGYCYLLYDPVAGVTDRDKGLPNSFSVSQNYPNPFNPTTTIEFDVPAKSQVNLTVYNVLGQKVKTLVNQEMAAGKFKTEWDGRSESGAQISSGIYFYKFEAGSYVMTKKMVMLK
ncbi:MAG: T9SS type A sorting domain-containing protein [Candidatus Zixiibacteriota bacterium]